MKLVPQIRLRTVFLLFFCAAVGLATSRDLLGALDPAIATAMVIGLVQQTRDLRRWMPSEEPPSNSLAFARKFAISWRCFIAVLIALSVIAALVARRGLLQIEDQQGVLLYVNFLFPTVTVCVIIVLCNSVMRWSPTVLKSSARSRCSVLLWLVAVPITALVVIYGGFVTFLVHKALFEIEAAFRPQFRRPGVYISLHDQSYLSLWFSVAAVIALIAGGVTLIRFVRKRNFTSASFGELVLSVLLLAVPTAFCGWYYTTGFYRISPELAGVGLEANWVEWLVGLFLSFILIITGSYRVARCNRATIVSSDISQDIESTSMHESVPCLLLIGVNSVYSLSVCATQIASISSVFGRRTFLNFVSMLWYPSTLLILAQAIASLQLCWVRWRRRNDALEWKLAGVSRSAFYQSCLGGAAMLLIGIPTLNAFAFIAWLGPWNLRPLFGY